MNEQIPIVFLISDPIVKWGIKLRRERERERERERSYQVRLGDEGSESNRRQFGFQAVKIGCPLWYESDSNLMIVVLM